MPIMRIVCPECGAGLKSPGEGFAVGQVVQCPKCETQFEVEPPVAARTTALPPAKTKALGKKTARVARDDDDDDDDDAPKKKKKKKKRAGDEDEEEWSYKNSWIRYAVLGVLLVILAVLAYFLWQKQKREREDNSFAPPAAVVRTEA